MVGRNVIDPGSLAENIRLKQAALQKAIAQRRMMLEANRGKPRGIPPAGDAPLMNSGPVKLPEGTSANESKKTDSLGKQVIEGVEAEGARTTFTIPAGEIGNTLPIEVVDETWYSPELQVVVMSRRRDPRFGETTYRLTNLNRSEPDRALFEVPADYTVKESSILPKPKPPKEEQ